jgi:hypothetical protein
VDPIRPIGPAEREIDPVVRVTRSSAPDRDGRRQEPGERRDPPAPRRPLPPPPASPASEDPDGPSLIDIKV